MFEEDKILTFVIVILLFLLSFTMMNMYNKNNIYNIENFNSHKNIPEWREKYILKKNNQIYNNWIKRDNILKLFIMK